MRFTVSTTTSCVSTPLSELRLRGAFSPFNWDCEAPPKVFRDSVFVAYPTENERLSPRISAYSLVGIYMKRLASEGRQNSLGITNSYSTLGNRQKVSREGVGW